MKKALKGFWLLFTRNEKKKILILLFLSTLAAVFEMLGISMVVPLVTAIVEPNQTGGLGVIQRIYSVFGITTYASALTKHAPHKKRDRACTFKESFLIKI